MKIGRATKKKLRAAASNKRASSRNHGLLTLAPWLTEATMSGVPELRNFAGGIRRDQAAILTALTYEWSQGQIEEYIQRLKLLKCQSYGRAGIDLLRHRVLARSV